MKSDFNIGAVGEDLACRFLNKKGYRILMRNLHLGFGEIDIVCRSREGMLVFVEVKSSGVLDDTFKPEDHFTTVKQKKVQRLAQYFANRYPSYFDDAHGWRVDLVTIVADGFSQPRIEHYEQVL